MGRDEPERNLERAWRWVVKGFIDWVMQLWLYLVSQNLSRYAPWNKSSIRWYYKNKLEKYHGKHCWTSQIFQYFHTPWNFQEIENMNRPFTSTEIESMLKKLPTNRSPGAEGLTKEIHQTFREQLTPILLKWFLKISEEITLPNSSYEATITLILPKPDKDNIHTKKNYIHVGTSKKDKTQYFSNVFIITSSKKKFRALSHRIGIPKHVHWGKATNTAQSCGVFTFVFVFLLIITLY